MATLQTTRRIWTTTTTSGMSAIVGNADGKPTITYGLDGYGDFHKRNRANDGWTRLTRDGQDIDLPRDLARHLTACKAIWAALDYADQEFAD